MNQDTTVWVVVNHMGNFVQFGSERSNPIYYTEKGIRAALKQHIKYYKNAQEYHASRGEPMPAWRGPDPSDWQVRRAKVVLDDTDSV